jgi:hypothetical protein
MKMVAGEEQKIDMNLGPLIFRIDPSTIALMTLLSAKAAEFNAAQAAANPAPEDESSTGFDDTVSASGMTPRGSVVDSIWDFANLVPADFEFSGEDLGGDDVTEPGGRIPPLVQPIYEAADALSLATRSSSRRSSTSSSINAVAEYLVVEAKKILITLEYGATGKPIPVIMLDSSITGDASNWSTNLDASFTASLQMACYNPEKGIWEPLLEPVETVSFVIVFTIKSVAEMI